MSDAVAELLAEEAGYVDNVPPTKRAADLMRSILRHVSPEPHLVSDECGGIIAYWRRLNRSIQLNIRGDDSQRDYIYWREDGASGVLDATAKNPTERLAWLTDLAKGR